MILIFWLFFDDIELPMLYDIKKSNIEYYEWFLLILMIFELFGEVFILSIHELLNEYKISDYLIYSRYRFNSRKNNWILYDDSSDDCVDGDLRELDHMCFSSEYYLVSCLHTLCLLFSVIGIEMIIRGKYNPFNDSCFIIMMLIFLIMLWILKELFIFILWCLRLWCVKHLKLRIGKDEKEEEKLPRWESIIGSRDPIFESDYYKQMINNDTFRYKFLNYNKSWIIEHLNEILTSESVEKLKPYLSKENLCRINNFDNGNNEEDYFYKYGSIIVKPVTRIIARLWLSRARRNNLLRNMAMGVIERNRRDNCEICHGKVCLRVDFDFALEDLADEFEDLHPNMKEFDVDGWNDYLNSHEDFHTYCYYCMSKGLDSEKKKNRLLNRLVEKEENGVKYLRDREEKRISELKKSGKYYSDINLNSASRAICRLWLSKARKSVILKKRKALEKEMLMKDYLLSSSEEERLIKIEEEKVDWMNRKVTLKSASKEIMLMWLNKARDGLIDRGVDYDKKKLLWENKHKSELKNGK